jgi:hypothetical protein
MRSLGATHLLVLALFVVLTLDSRRLHALARLTSRGRKDLQPDRGIPAGAHPDRVGLPLAQIQMRTNVDWQDGGAGWDGPEVLPVEESEDGQVDDPGPEPRHNPALPVLWKPFPPWATPAVFDSAVEHAEDDEDDADLALAG